MPVAAEIASMLDALDAPAMLIRPDDMTVAAVNGAFAQAYGRFASKAKVLGSVASCVPLSEVRFAVSVGTSRQRGRELCRADAF